MKMTWITAAALMVAASAFAQSTTEKTGINSLMGVAPSTEDFIMQAAASDMFEIESSKLAVARTADTTKTFAEQMIADHTKTSTELKTMLQDSPLKASIPPTMSSAQQAMLDELKNLNGEQFLDQYHEDQAAVHKDAVDLFDRYSKEGENVELKTWAAKTLPALQHHLMMAQDMDK